MFDINDVEFTVSHGRDGGWQCVWLLAHGGAVQRSGIEFGVTPVSAVIHGEIAARREVLKLNHAFNRAVEVEP